MKTRVVPLLLLSATIAGCSATERLYPVQGPLAAQRPLPVYVATMDGVVSGNIRTILNTGEVCAGTWSRVVRVSSSDAADAVIDVPPVTLSEQWDGVYGAGYYTAHIVDAPSHAHSVVSGSRGPVLYVEFVKLTDIGRRSGPGSIVGIAKDNRGNVFRLTF